LCSHFSQQPIATPRDWPSLLLAENEKWISVSVGFHNFSSFQALASTQLSSVQLSVRSAQSGALMRIHHLAFSVIFSSGFAFGVFVG